MTAQWFVRQPLLFRRECAELARDYPEMQLNQQAFDAGTLTFEGTLRFEFDAQTESVDLLLQYPPTFPYFPPRITPRLEQPVGSGNKEKRFFSARHQMADGSICLFQHDPVDDPHGYTSGIKALGRARLWLSHAIRGVLPKELDSIESELETHYQRSGDVLLGPEMFDGGAEGGELILCPFPERSGMGRFPLYMVTHVESGGTWRTDQVTLQRVGVNLPADFWAASPPTTLEKIRSVRRIRWYSLDREPNPIQSTFKLAELLFPSDAEPLARLKEELPADLSLHPAIYVPLRFPSRKAGTFDWLFISIHIPVSVAQTVDGHTLPILDGTGRKALADAPISILRGHDLRRVSLEIRNTTRVPRNAADLSFGLAGAGSLGSSCADLLAKAGIGRMRIADFAALSSHNAVRHLAGVSAAGLPKALIVAATASAHNPHCDVTSLYHPVGDILAVPQDDPIWGMNAILSTIADDAFELALNREAVARGVTVYYLRALRSGTVGRLVRVRPGIDACFECVGHYHREGSPKGIVIQSQESEVITRECGQPVLASSAADLAVIAGLAMKTLLFDASAVAEHNHWIWAMEGVPENVQLRDSFSKLSLALAPHPKCTVCCIAAPRRVRISSSAKERIVALAKQHAPNETGGILIGRRSADVLDVLCASDAGPLATSKPVRFERDGPYCQTFLQQTVSELGEGIDYIGEWHSHPNSSAMPSTRDTDSLVEIAEDPNFLTTAPLLIIVAPSQAGDNVDWSSMIFPLDGSAREVSLEALPDDDVLHGKSAMPDQIASIDTAAAAPSASTT